VHPSLCFPATSLAKPCKADDDHSSSADVSSFPVRKLARCKPNKTGGDGETRWRDVLRGRTTPLTEKFAAGQTSRRQHGSQKRLGAVRHQVIFSALHGHPQHLHYLLFLQDFVLRNCNIYMQQVGQRPATDPHIYIPRRQHHGPKPLGEGQRPTPRLSVYGVWGSRTGEVVMRVESCSLGGRKSGGAKLGVGGIDGMCCGFSCLGESGLVEMPAGLTWNESIATRSIGPQSRASPTWQVWIC
jgi:hypothetical protein